MFSFLLLLLLLKNQSQEPSNSQDGRILANDCSCLGGTFTIGSTYHGQTWHNIAFQTLVANCYHKPDRDSKCPIEGFTSESELNCWDVSGGKSLFYGFAIDFKAFVVLTKD